MNPTYGSNWRNEGGLWNNLRIVTMQLTDDDIGLGELTKYVYKKKKAVARPPYSLCLHMCK